jgi:hypothetical protein
MPWDGTDLWVADLGPDGRRGPACHIAGGPQESVVQPEWNAEGVLQVVSDRSGWWNLYRERHGQVESLLAMAAEFADAPGSSTTRAMPLSVMGALPVATDATAGTGSACSTHNLVGSPTCRFRIPRSSPTFGRSGIAWPSSAPAPRPARPWRPCRCQRVTSTSWPGPRFFLIRPGCRCQSRSSSRPGTARRPTPSITHPPTQRSPGQQMPGRRCWCRPILGRPPTPRPALTCGPSSSPAAGSRWWR